MNLAAWIYAIVESVYWIFSLDIGLGSGKPIMDKNAVGHHVSWLSLVAGCADTLSEKSLC
jgi:hypothetical protein